MIQTRTSNETTEIAGSPAERPGIGRRLIASLRHLSPQPNLPPTVIAPAAVVPAVKEPERVYLFNWQVYAGYEDADRAVFDPFPAVEAEPEPGFLINFLGVRTRVSFVNAFARHDGRVFGTPLPLGDGYFSETIEYIGLLKSIRTAQERYTALEFGAGWAPWLVSGAAAARRKGIEKIRLHGIEADAGHFASMVTHFQDNGLDPAEHRLDNAAVGVEEGWARWPKVQNAAADWSSRPLIDPGESRLAGGRDHLGRDFQEHIDVRVLAFRDVLEREDAWDLVHIDVQGTEAEICTAAADTLDRRVRWLVIGTHSRKIEGDLTELFYRRGWILENERPALLRYKVDAPSLESMTYNDGTQIWRNPALCGPDRLIKR